MCVVCHCCSSSSSTAILLAAFRVFMCVYVFMHCLAPTHPLQIIPSMLFYIIIYRKKWLIYAAFSNSLSLDHPIWMACLFNLLRHEFNTDCVDFHVHAWQLVEPTPAIMSERSWQPIIFILATLFKKEKHTIIIVAVCWFERKKERLFVLFDLSQS